jgi:hypothetical protein
MQNEPSSSVAAILALIHYKHVTYHWVKFTRLIYSQRVARHDIAKLYPRKGKTLHMFAAFQPSFSILAALPHLALIVPLLIVCLAVIVGLCVAASKSRLHIPAYVGMAFCSFALAMIVGHISGSPSVTGTSTGFALSIFFFLLIAVTVGSVLALFFYHQPEV